MKTITKIYNLYEFDELTDEAKDKAVEKLWDLNVDHDWWEWTLEDAKSIGLKITEFDIDHQICNGKLLIPGFDTANKIIENHGEKCDTFSTATQYLSDHKELHEKYKDEIEAGNTWDYDSELEDLETELTRSLLEDYLLVLRKEYEHLTSKEAIIECIKSNEYTFLEDGTMRND